MLGLEQEDRHLVPPDRVVPAVVTAAAARRDAVAQDLLDEVVEEVALRHVQEVREPAGRKRRAGDGRRSACRSVWATVTSFSVPGESPGD